MTRKADRAAAKHFASRRARQDDAPEVPFSVDFIRDNEVEAHHFTARPRLLFGPMVGLIKYGDQNDARSVTHLARLIRQCLVNNDGTPEKWEPHIVRPDDADPYFTAPNGDHAPLDELPKYLELSAGSSRRRWTQLMEHDDDVEIDFEVIEQVLEYLIEQVAGRPT